MASYVQNSYSHHLERDTIERVPSGIFFAAAHLEHLTNQYEKGINPLHFQKPSEDSGYESAEQCFYLADAIHSSAGAPRSSNTRCLPILDVNIEVDVKSSIAKTKVTQTFTNVSSFVIKEANYSFPLYDGAAVVEFRCHIGDDRVLEGVVKTKDVRKCPQNS
jgi:hypothetical protein